MPRPVDSMFDNVATKTADPDVESVASNADLATVFTHAASVVLSADSAEALVVEPVVAEADGDDARPRLRPTSKPSTRPKPSINPARVVVATTSKAASPAGIARTSSMVSDVTRPFERADQEQHACDAECE